MQVAWLAVYSDRSVLLQCIMSLSLSCNAVVCSWHAGPGQTRITDHFAAARGSAAKAAASASTTANASSGVMPPPSATAGIAAASAGLGPKAALGASAAVAAAAADAFNVGAAAGSADASASGSSADQPPPFGTKQAAGLYTPSSPWLTDVFLDSTAKERA